VFDGFSICYVRGLIDSLDLYCLLLFMVCLIPDSNNVLLF
jgi:hypothetical protein